MSPQKKIQEKLDINSISPIISSRGDIKVGEIEGTGFGIKKVPEEEKRISTFHYVVHTLAFMIVIPYLFMIWSQIDVPREYTTIVSVVIGFYFGRALLK